MSSSLTEVLPWPIAYVIEQHWFWRDCAGSHEPLFFSLLRHNGFPYDATHKPYGHIKRFWSIVFQFVFICSSFRLHLSPLLCFIAILNIIFIFYYEILLIRMRKVRGRKCLNFWAASESRARFRLNTTSLSTKLCHYESTPFQIYRKFILQKLKSFR